MNRTASMLAALLFVTLALCSVPSSAPAASAADGRVVIVLAPYITWDDVMSGAMPATRALAETSAVGDINIRSSARYALDPGQTHIATTMSAGSPAAFDLTAVAAYALDHPLESGTAAEIYQRSMQRDPAGFAIAYLGLPRVIRANSVTTLNTVPGALGQAIVDAGGVTAAIGNSDGGRSGGEVRRSRPAAIIAMDASGLVGLGDISADLIVERAEAPFGIATDLSAVESALDSALEGMGEHGGPGLIVIDPGDPERAFNFAPDASPDSAEAHRLAAARTIDSVVALAQTTLPSDAVLMVISSGQMRPAAGPSGFGPVIINGPGFEGGMVSSPSTHRAGLITDLDVAATALSALGIERPVEVLGNAAAPAEAPGDLERSVAFLTEINDTAVAVDTVRPAVQNSYITVTVLVLLGCAVLLRPMQRALHGWGGTAATWFGRVILLMLAMPVSATLMFLPVPRPGSAALVGGLFALVTLVVWAAALAVDRRWGSAVALASLGLFSAGVLLIDQALGAPLSFTGMFSYSPLLGARYYGLGNEGASVVVGSGLAGLGLLLDVFRDRTWAARASMWGPLVLGALVVVVTAAPFLGANIGVIAWGTVAFGIMWIGLRGRRITWKSLLGMALIIGLVVVAFSAYDLLSGSGSQTHLGRAWESAETGGVAELWTIVQRKAETNWRVLRATNWSILMIAILGFLGFMRWRPHGVFAETLKAYPAFAVAMTASLWGSVVGYFTEDSGIVIPAIVMLYVAGSLLHVMLSRLRHKPAEVLT